MNVQPAAGVIASNLLFDRLPPLGARRFPLFLRTLAATFLAVAPTLGAAPAWSAPSATPAPAQGGRAGTVGYSDESISPDGHHISWVSQSEIYVSDISPSGTAAGQPEKIAKGEGPIWAPDSSQLAYLANEGSTRQQEIYVINAKGGTPTKVTDVVGSITNPGWLPNGKSLGFLYVENALQPDPLFPVPPPTGVVGEHWLEQRLAVVDLATRHVRIVTPADLYLYEFDFSPDGSKAAAVAVTGPPNDNWFIAQLYLIDVASGATKSILNPGIELAIPQWSPDGNKIGFLGGLMSGHAGRSGDIWTVSPDGSDPEDLTGGNKFSCRSFAWAPAGKIVITQLIHGDMALAEIDLAQGNKVKQVWTSSGFSSEGASVGGFYYEVSLAKDGKTTVATLESFNRPPEIWAGPINALKQITHANDGIQPKWGKVDSVDWTSEGWNVQGWLYYPLDYDPQKRYAMVLEIHGGPTFLVKPSFGDEDGLSAEGYFAFCPNYVGSAGEGEAFKRGIVRNVGYADFRSIMAGVYKVLEKYPAVDKNRIGITGWSNGGFLSMWAVTQTDLFRAAVPGAGIADWVSYYGQNDIDQWNIPWFGSSAYDDPYIYIRSSPMTFIKNVKTPTLILVGEDDAECPAAQSLQYWHALRDLGVKTQLVIYPGEGHSFSKPEDRLDVSRRRLEWFREYLK